MTQILLHSVTGWALAVRARRWTAFKRFSAKVLTVLTTCIKILNPPKIIIKRNSAKKRTYSDVNFWDRRYHSVLLHIVQRQNFLIYFISQTVPLFITTEPPYSFYFINWFFDYWTWTDEFKIRRCIAFEIRFYLYVFLEKRSSLCKII